MESWLGVCIGRGVARRGNRVGGREREARRERGRDSHEADSALCAPFLSSHPSDNNDSITPSFIDLLRTYYVLNTDLGTKDYPVNSSDSIPTLMEFDSSKQSHQLTCVCKYAECRLTSKNEEVRPDHKGRWGHDAREVPRPNYPAAPSIDQDVGSYLTSTEQPRSIFKQGVCGEIRFIFESSSTPTIMRMLLRLALHTCLELVRCSLLFMSTGFIPDPGPCTFSGVDGSLGCSRGRKRQQADVPLEE